MLSKGLNLLEAKVILIQSKLQIRLGESGLCCSEDGAIFRRLWPEAYTALSSDAGGEAGNMLEIWQDAGPGNGPGASTLS